MNKDINIVYDFLSELGGIERVIVFQANALKKEGELNPKIFFSYVEPGKKTLLQDKLGLVKNVPVFCPRNSGGQIFNFINNMLFPNRFFNLPGPIISHSFLSSRMAYARKYWGGGNYIIIAQHPPNFLYDRSWKWANNIPRKVAYIAGTILGPLLRKWDKEAMLGADTIYVNSEYTKKRIEKIYKHKDVKIMYPPIGEQFQVSPKKERELQKNFLMKIGKIQNPFILLHGRQIKDKHPEWAIQAFSQVQDDNLDLVISGTIEEKDKLISLTDDLGIRNKVHMLGKVSEEELLALYNNAKCFIMCAPKEDFGLTTVEALACGCPAIAWDDGAGPSEVIINNENGLLAKPYNIKDMAMKIDKVLETKYNRNKVSKSVNKFKAKAIKKQFLDAVKELCLEYEYKYH